MKHLVAAGQRLRLAHRDRCRPAGPGRGRRRPCSGSAAPPEPRSATARWHPTSTGVGADHVQLLELHPGLVQEADLLGLPRGDGGRLGQRVELVVAEVGSALRAAPRPSHDRPADPGRRHASAAAARPPASTSSCERVRPLRARRSPRSCPSASTRSRPASARCPAGRAAARARRAGDHRGRARPRSCAAAVGEREPAGQVERGPIGADAARHSRPTSRSARPDSSASACSGRRAAHRRSPRGSAGRPGPAAGGRTPAPRGPPPHPAPRRLRLVSRHHARPGPERSVAGSSLTLPVLRVDAPDGDALAHRRSRSASRGRAGRSRSCARPAAPGRPLSAALAGMIASATPSKLIRVRPAGRSTVRVSVIIARPPVSPRPARSDAARSPAGRGRR